MTVEGDEPLSGEESQPKVGRHCRVAQVLTGTLRHVEIGLLENVGRVDASLETVVETQLDHPPQSLTMKGEEFDQSPSVSTTDPEKQVIVLARLTHCVEPS